MIIKLTKNIKCISVLDIIDIDNDVIRVKVVFPVCLNEQERQKKNK